MKKIYLLLALCFTMHVAYSQEPVADSVKESEPEKCEGNNPITFNLSVGLGSTSVANHFISAHEYNYVTYGFHLDFGRFYKPWKNVSWNLAFDYNPATLHNSAQTSSISYTALSLNYSSSYNWQFGKGFMVKVGGGLDVSGDMITNLTDITNNAVSLNGLAQLEASIGASYTFKFKTWMLGFSGNISTPFAGLVLTDAKHETGADSWASNSLIKHHASHFKLTSFSNMQGVDYDITVKFVAPRVAISLGVTSENRWWYINDIQNRRKNIMFRIGAGFDLVSLKQTKTINRYF